MKIMIDPEEGWRYGFPREAPDDFHDEDFDFEGWLVSMGYPKGKKPHYVRYYETSERP